MSGAYNLTYTSMNTYDNETKDHIAKNINHNNGEWIATTQM